MARIVTVFFSKYWHAIHYGDFIQRCRCCGADLADFLSFNQEGEFLRCLICNEEVPIDDVSYDGGVYQYDGTFRIVRKYGYVDNKEWRKSRRRIPK